MAKKKKKLANFRFVFWFRFQQKMEINGDREKNFQRNEKEEKITGVHFPDWEIFELASTSILGEKINSPPSPFCQKMLWRNLFRKTRRKNFEAGSSDTSAKGKNRLLSALTIVMSTRLNCNVV